MSTVAGYSVIGISSLFEFITTIKTGDAPVGMATIRASHIRQLIAWLSLKYRQPSTAQNKYSCIKSLLTGLIERRHILVDPATMFPANPFPGANRSKKGVSALSASEMQRLANALKADIVAIHKKSFRGHAAEALVVNFLIVSMRSGGNTTPLIEMGRDALAPHPFLPNMMLLKTRKRRNDSSILTSLKSSVSRDLVQTIQLDAVAILKQVISATDALVDDAPERLKNRVWLYRTLSRGVHPGGEVTALTNITFSSAVRDFLARHELVADDGTPMRVSPQRLRKTMENRLWRLSDGDLIGVAAIMGHVPQVADQSYLRLDAALKVESAHFVGEVLPEILRNDGRRGSSIETQLHNTPTGRCKDSFYGGKAPKDGTSECEQFTHCLSCPSYAIVGTVEDLHRLFSFQRFLVDEINYYGGAEWQGWREHHESLVKAVDALADTHFRPNLVAEAKALALSAPHKFWAIRAERARSARGVGSGN